MSYIPDGMYARIGDLRRARGISRGGHQLRSLATVRRGECLRRLPYRALIEDHGFRKGEAGTGKAVEWGGAGCRRSGDLMRWGGLCEVDSSLSGTVGSKKLHIITVLYRLLAHGDQGLEGEIEELPSLAAGPTRTQTSRVYIYRLKIK